MSTPRSFQHCLCPQLLSVLLLYLRKRKKKISCRKKEKAERSSSLNSLCISSLAESMKKRFVKFRFHDLSRRKSQLAELKIDSGAEANVIPLVW